MLVSGTLFLAMPSEAMGQGRAAILQPGPAAQPCAGLSPRGGPLNSVSTVFSCHPIRRLSSYADLLKAVYGEGR